MECSLQDKSFSLFKLLFLLFLLGVDEEVADADYQRHCHDLWLYHDIRTSGHYQIDPDGDGGMGPFRVSCDMGDGIDERKVVTIVHHDSEAVGHVKGAETAGSYVRNITYKNSTEAQIIALIDVSTNCEQLIKWHCKGAKWVGRDWEPQYYWGGAATDSRTCGCHPYCEKTENNSTCNCDANSKVVWLTDEGLLLDKKRLPVLQLRMGDTGQPNEVGQYTLGPLKCRNVLLKDISLQNFTAPAKLASPGFPRYYPRPFHRYHWDVTIPENKNIEIVFPTYDVVHYGAYLSVPGCETVMRLHAQSQSTPGTMIEVQKQKLSVPYFVSDGSQTVVRVTLVTCNQMESITEKGFEAEFRETVAYPDNTPMLLKCSECHLNVGYVHECAGCGIGNAKSGGVTTCNRTCGIIASHNYPYPYHDFNPPLGIYNHTWIIAAVKHRSIQLAFNDFDIPGTPGSRQPSGGRLVGQFCNFNKQGNLYSRGHIMRLVYVARFDKVGNGRGFHATYKITHKHKPSHSDDEGNIALGKPALQSSTLENQGPHLAVDGITNGVLAAGSSCISTTFEREPWWRVDLQRRYIIHRVKIYNRELKMPSSSNSPVWPKGRYGLPKPRIGCPATSQSQWESGMHYQDMECPVAMDGSIKHWSDGSQLKGGLQELQGIEQHFCMLTDQNPEERQEWMPGQYCIFRYGGTCPTGFRTGYIRWKEKEGSNNKNRKEGVVPDGIYDNYTLIHFCCRGDGEVDQPIRLPTGTPFYLLQYGMECQKVEGMNPREHFFHFCEDRLADIDDPVFFQKPHPHINPSVFERATSLRGFQVLVDNYGYIKTRTSFWDNKHYGIAHEAHDKFSKAYICINHPVSEAEVPIVDKNCTQPVPGQFVTLYVYDRYDSLQVCEVQIYGK
uniref:CUB domain-containing protein n=1 Tax=Strigamia maritima TaxID=126957 RepID=T1JII4_STRMM